jgi:hypothetical protein
MPQARHVEREPLYVEGQVRRHDVSDAQKLKGLEAENGKLKRLLAEAMIDNAGLKDLLAKKW